MSKNKTGVFSTIKSAINNKLATLDFWYAKKTIKINREYTFMVDMDSNNAIAIKFLSKYSGVIVEYSNIHINSDDALSFDFNVIANPELHNIESNKFRNFSNNVMRSIIINTLNSVKDTVDNNRKDYESGNIDSIEFDQEREIHEESNSLLEKRISKRKIGTTSTRRNKKIH